MVEAEGDLAVHQAVVAEQAAGAIADNEPGLARLDSDPPPVTRELWLMTHPELRDLTRISVVVNWLVSVVGEFLDGQSKDAE